MTGVRDRVGGLGIGHASGGPASTGCFLTTVSQADLGKYLKFISENFYSGIFRNSELLVIQIIKKYILLVG